MEPGFIADSFQTLPTNANSAISFQNDLVTANKLEPIGIVAVENQSFPCIIAPGNDRTVEDMENLKENPLALDHIHISTLSSSLGSETGTRSTRSLGKCVIPEYCDGMQSAVSFGKTETTEKGSLAESDPTHGTSPRIDVPSETVRSTTNPSVVKAGRSDSDLIVPPDLLTSHDIQQKVLKPNPNVWFCFSAPSENYLRSCRTSGRASCNKRSAQVFPDMLADDGECLCSDSFPREEALQNAAPALPREDVAGDTASQSGDRLPDVVLENI